MIKFMSQLDWVIECLDIWSNILVVSLKVTLGEINI